MLACRYGHHVTFYAKFSGLLHDGAGRCNWQDVSSQMKNAHSSLKADSQTPLLYYPHSATTGCSANQQHGRLCLNMMNMINMMMPKGSDINTHNYNA